MKIEIEIIEKENSENLIATVKVDEKLYLNLYRESDENFLLSSEESLPEVTEDILVDAVVDLANVILNNDSLSDVKK